MHKLLSVTVNTISLQTYITFHIVYVRQNCKCYPLIVVLYFFSDLQWSFEAQSVSIEQEVILKRRVKLKFLSTKTQILFTRIHCHFLDIEQFCKFWIHLLIYFSITNITINNIVF